MTDSGGFQVYSLADTRNITEEGVTFKKMCIRDSRYTMRDGFLYAIQLEPSGRIEELTLPSLAYDLKQPRILHARIRQVELLGESQLLSWSQDDQGLHLQLPACSQKQPRVLRLSF